MGYERQLHMKSGKSVDAGERVAACGAQGDDQGWRDVVLDVPLRVAMEIGRARTSIREVVRLAPGTVIELDRPAGEPLAIYANGTLIARGEVVVINDRYGVRFTDVISPGDRAQVSG